SGCKQVGLVIDGPEPLMMRPPLFTTIPPLLRGTHSNIAVARSVDSQARSRVLAMAGVQALTNARKPELETLLAICDMLSRPQHHLHQAVALARITLLLASVYVSPEPTAFVRGKRKHHQPSMGAIDFFAGF